MWNNNRHKKIGIFNKSFQSGKIGETERGYAALMSTLVISFILSAVILSVSFESFFGRQNILNSELKEISFSLAEGCLQKAVLIIVQSPNFEINEHNKILFSNLTETEMKPDLTCTFKSLEREGSVAEIIIQARAGKAITNLKAHFDETDLEIVSVEELPTFFD